MNTEKQKEMAFSIIITIIAMIGVVWIFNPYLAHRWRSTRERWTTRERSHGHPFYWMMRFGDKDSAYDFDADQGCTRTASPGPLACGEKTCTSMHRDLYNRPAKAVCNVKNIIYIE